MEHRAQTVLYTLLPWGCYVVDTKDRLPFYNQSEGEGVRASWGRNFSCRRGIPATSHRRRVHASDVIPVILPQGTPESLIFCSQEAANVRPTYYPSISPIFDARTGHLTPKQPAFFGDWERSRNALQEGAWDACIGKREERGRCCSGMVVESPNNYGTADKIGGEWGRG